MVPEWGCGLFSFRGVTRTGNKQAKQTKRRAGRRGAREQKSKNTNDDAGAETTDQRRRGRSDRIRSRTQTGTAADGRREDEDIGCYRLPQLLDGRYMSYVGWKNQVVGMGPIRTPKRGGK
ncbi:MAG: hypothetical protein V8S76_06665 [Lachnospiraceae bacterium]